MADKLYKWVDGQKIEITQAEFEAEFPPIELPDPVTMVRAGDLWERMTNAEAEIVAQAITQQPVRIQEIFRNRTEYHSDHELWPLLESMAVQLFGEQRASELLAPSN